MNLFNTSGIRYTVSFSRLRLRHSIDAPIILNNSLYSTSCSTVPNELSSSSILRKCNNTIPLAVKTNSIRIHSRRLHSSSSPTDLGVGTVSQAPTTTTIEKMKSDKRYQTQSPVPEHLLTSMNSDKAHSPGFSIKGAAMEGRPAYLGKMLSIEIFSLDINACNNTL